MPDEEKKVLGETLNLQSRIWVTDEGDLVFDPQKTDSRYPYMPTVAEVLAGYCITSDLEVPGDIKNYLGDNSKKFLEEKYLHILKERRGKAEKGPPSAGGDPYALGELVTAALRDRGIEDAEKDGAINVFQRPIHRIAGSEELQKKLGERVSPKLREILGKTGFNSYVLPY